MLPALMVLAALSIVPFVVLIAMSVSKVSTLGRVSLQFAGLANWQAVLTDSSIWAAWGRSAIHLAAIISLEMVAGLVVAVVLHHLVRARSLVLALVLLPMFLAPVMVGLLGRFLFDSTIGLYARLLQLLGLDQDLLASPGTALPTVIAIDVWQWTPLIALILLAGLVSVPASTAEAAAVDGAGFLRTLWSVTLPQMRAVIIVALLVRCMDAIRFFDIITATTNGGPADSTKTVPLKLYELAFRFNNQMGKAAVLALMMLISSIVLARLFLRAFADRDGATYGGGR
ncbi:carbohydrate ABC transporter permease [Pseudonocardia sp. CA-107938]|uniref:carbohydrate ABC transporter permease n=1 Tax=Pseudonocardia sp. CA-107938 TaxID=3240021 RepID=UPI003D945BD9